MVYLLAPSTAPMRDFRSNGTHETILSTQEALSAMESLRMVWGRGLLTESEFVSRSIELLLRSVPSDPVSAIIADLLAWGVAL